MKSPLLHSLYLILDNKCNLKCDFCYQKNYRFENKKEPAGAGFQEISKFILDNPSIEKIFITGGEPLLKKDLLLDLLNFINIENEKNKKKIFVNIITNGTVFIDELKKYKSFVSLQISIDGGKKSHDFYRKFSDQKGSYLLVISNFWKYLLGGLQITIHSVVAPATILLFEKEKYRMFKDIPSDIPIKIVTEHTHRINIFTSWYMKNKILKIISWAKATKIHDNFIFNNSSTSNICGAGISSVALDVSSAHIYPCMECAGDHRYVIGENFLIDSKKQERYYRELLSYKIQFLPKKLSDYILLNVPLTICPLINYYWTKNEFIIPGNLVLQAFMEKRKLSTNGKFNSHN